MQSLNSPVLPGTEQIIRRSSGMVRSKIALVIVSTAIAVCPVRAESGLATFYSGGRTASGEVTGPKGLTAAHRTLPFGTKVVVTNLRSGKTVVVRITDRGPYRRGRIIDVSRAAARELDMIGSGTAMVSIERQPSADTPNPVGEILSKAEQLLDPPR